MPKITKRTVDAAAPRPGQRFYVWDDQIKGFGLLVLPSGVKSYFYRYRTPEGRERRATIGKHGTWTPDAAREKAEGLARAVGEGRDPLEEKAGARQAVTVGEIFDLYLKSGRFQEKAGSTQAIDQGRIERHLRPLLGKSHAHKLKPEDVRRAFGSIKAGKTAAKIKTGKRGLARVSGGEGTARSAIRLLRAILNWAVGEGLTERNPAAGVAVGADGRRDAILEGPDDYARLFRTLDSMEAEKCIRRPVADAIRVIALTGARRGEISGLRWSFVDLRAGRLTIPATSHKTGRRTGDARVIGLPSAAQAIIARQPEGGPDDFVFQPAVRNGKDGKPIRPAGPLDLSHPWREVRVAAELPEGIGLHGLRHALASHMAMEGAQASEIMTALGHRQMSTAQRYVHWAADARRKLAERSASVALAGLIKASDDSGADIVDLPKASK